MIECWVCPPLHPNGHQPHKEEDEDRQDNHAVINLRNEVLELRDEIRELKELLKQNR